MPVAIKYKCLKCRGETDTENTLCIYCSMLSVIKSIDGAKHLPSNYFNK
jgi:hypothetical protein